MVQQEQLVKEVRKRFPKHTYKQLGEIFQMQTTRLFRLMNGAEMRTSEYFKIKEKLEINSSELSLLIQFLEKHSFSLSRNDCNEIVSDLEEKFFIRKLAGL